MISIIIPVFNAAKYLHRCLDSIIAQTYKDWECILVDDGSNDGSSSLCDEYAQKDIRFKVLHKKNGGASSARNEGLKNIHGKYICFCDADDYVEKNWLDVFATKISKTDLVIASFYHYHNSYGKRQSTYDFNVNKPAVALAIISCGECGFLWNKCFKAEIIKTHQIHFNEQYVFCEDEEFVTHYMTYIHSVLFTSEHTYNYFLPESFEQKYRSIKIYQTMVDIYCHVSQFVPKERFYMIAYDNILRRMLVGIIPYYYSKQFSKALLCLKNICRITQSLPDLKLGNSRVCRFFINNHPLFTHRIYILMSILHILK